MSCDVNIATGEVLHDGVDVDLPGLFEISCIRSYSTTRSHERGSLGFGWKHNLEVWLETTDEGFTLHEGDAVIDGRWDEQTAEGRPRASRESHGAILSQSDGSILGFAALLPHDPRMFLVIKRDAYDNRMHFRYDQDRLASVTTPEGRVLSFAYSPSGLLASISVSHQSIQPEPLTLVRYTYDPNDDLAEVSDQRGFSERYGYADHLIVTHVNRLGGETYYAYDASRRCCASWETGDRNVRRLEYDPLRRTTFVTDSYGYRVLQRLNDAGQIIAQVDPLGYVTESVYDEQGRHVAMFDDLGMVGSSEMFDPELRLRRDYNGAGEGVIVQLDDRGRVARRGCPAADMLSYTYDNQGAISSIRTREGYGWTFEYDDRGRLVHAVDTSGYTLRQDFSRDGFQTRLSDQFGPLEYREFDVVGNVIRYESADRSTLDMSYAAQDCPVTETLGDGRQSRFQYDAELHLLEEVDPSGHASRFQYDAFGMVLVEQDPLKHEQRYEYDRDYRLARLTNKKGQQFEFEYDAVGNEIRRRFFENDERRAVYDARGRCRTMVDAGGGVTAFEYDGDDRIASQVLPDGTRQVLERDEAGHVVMIIETRTIDGLRVERRLALSYRSDGLPLREEDEDRWIEFDYDPAGHVTGVRDSWGGETRYRRGRRYNVEAIQEAGKTFQISWRSDDYLSEVRYPNGMRQIFETDSFGRLVSREMVAVGGRVLSRREFRYGDTNQLIVVTDSYDGTQQFTYDLAGRLTGVTDAAGRQLERYGYDPDDNLVQSHAGALTVGAGDQVTASRSWTYEYDSCGRMRARSNTKERWALDFDADEQLTRVRKGDVTVATYSYDLLSRRKGKVTEDGESGFLYDGLTALRAERHGGRLVRYVYIPGLEIPIACYVGDEWFYYSFDQLGMPTEVWDDQGRLRCRIKKEAYGTGREIVDLVGAEPPLPFLFPGQYYDGETGFCYNTYRYYQPDTASYLTRDMLSYEEQLNHYSYPRDPLMSCDRDGLMPSTLTFECKDAATCKWDKMPCAKRIARLKIAKLNREAQKRQLRKCAHCKRTKQRKYYEDTCGGTAGSTHQVDHFHELQAGGADKCCRNLVAIPTLINNCLGKMIGGAAGMGLKGVNVLIAKGTKIGWKGCSDGKNTAGCSKQQWKDAYKRAPKQDCEKPESVC